MTATVVRRDPRAARRTELRQSARPQPGPDRRRLAALAGSCALGAAVEAAVLVVALPDARQLAPQATALGPLAVFHDVRWLMTGATSGPVLAVGAVALLIGRGAVLAALARLAGADRRSPLRSWADAAGFTAVTAVLLSPLVALLYGVALVPFSWPYLAAAPAALIVCLLLGHGPRPGWWRFLPDARALGATLLDALMLMAASASLLSVAAAYAVPVAALAGAANAGAWLLAATPATRRLPARPAVLRRTPWAPVSAVAFLGAAMVGAWAGFAVHATPQHPRPAASTVTAAGRPVVVVAGFGASCCRKDDALHVPGLATEQFSYAGLDAAGRPIPHGRKATDRSLPALAADLARQVDVLHTRTGRRVAILAESEGTLVTARYLATHPGAPVDRAVLLSPILAPARADPDAAARRELAGVVRAVHAISPFDVRADGPFLRSVNRDDLGAVAVPTTLVLPVADALTLPVQRPGVPVVVVDGFHGGLLGDHAMQQRLRAWLLGDERPPAGGWPATVTLIADAAAAWRVPPLR